MPEFDVLQRFLFEESKIRGEIVRLRATYQATLERHPYPDNIQRLLGEALAATALLSAILKFEGLLTLQIQGDGPVNPIVVQSDHLHYLRGLAQWREKTSFTEFKQLVGNGHLALTITPKQGERYQGIVELKGNCLADCLETYFHQSEQLPSVLFLCADQHTAAGMLLQLMPDDRSAEHYQTWEHIKQLAHTLSAEELLTLDNQVVLKRLFHEEDVLLFPSQPVAFHCTCTIERMEKALMLMSATEIDELLNIHKKIDVTCEFCNSQYTFDATDIARIRTQSQ